MDTNILELENVTKEFPGTVALDGVTFNVKKGSIHGLIGENGAGKSTLIKILTGAYSMTEGSVVFDNELLEDLNPAMSQSLGIQCIYQELNISKELSVSENVYLGSLPTNQIGLIKWKELNDNAQKIFDRLNVDIKADRKASEYSIADHQMIEIAKAISQNVRLLIMDEPTSSLSEVETQNLLELTMELKSQGVTIIYITHHLNEIFEICDSVTVLRDGKHIKTLLMEEIEGESDLVQLMVNRTVGNYYNKTNTPSQEILLEVENLSVDNVLKDINFSMKKGEILGIAGLVGSGRSELVETLFGRYKKDSGDISINGNKVEINHPSDAINHGIALVTENRKETGLLLQQNLKENISLPNLEKYGKVLINKNIEENITEEYKENMNIRAHSINQNISTLSGGNQQKAIIARWLIQNPIILMLDEPVRGVDVGAKSEIFSEVNRLANEGIGILMVSSEIPEIVGMSDRVIVMHEGEISGELSGSQINPDNILELAFGGSVVNGK